MKMKTIDKITRKNNIDYVFENNLSEELLADALDIGVDPLNLIDDFVSLHKKLVKFNERLITPISTINQ